MRSSSAGQNTGAVIAYIGLGSNIGDARANCQAALELIGQVEGIKILRSSSFYRTEPVGDISQGWFVNAAAELRTTMSPEELFDALKSVEKAMGRQPGVKWGPRIIDLDILFYGQIILKDKGLFIPHPELHKRRFVMIPMLEIAPNLIHPAFCVSLAGLMGRLKDDKTVELAPHS